MSVISLVRAHWKKTIAVLFKVLFISFVVTFLFFPEKLGLSPLLFKDLTPQALWEALTQIDPTTAVIWFTFATSIKLVGIFCGVTRWRILLRAQGVHIPFWYLVKCWFWGRAIGLFMPGTLGLDGYRLVESSHYTGEIVKCTTVIAVEKLTGFIALF